MSFLQNNKHLFEKKLKRARKELRDLKDTKILINNEKPFWKQSPYHNKGFLNLRRNSLIEQSELYYPWFPSLEVSNAYQSLSFQYVHPYSIRLFLVVKNYRKPYQIHVSSPSGVFKTKEFSSFEKATKYTIKEKKKIERTFEKIFKEIDNTIIQKEEEILALEKAFNIFCNNRQTKKTRKIS